MCAGVGGRRVVGMTYGVFALVFVLCHTHSVGFMVLNELLYF